MMRYLLATLLLATPLLAEGPEFDVASIKTFVQPKIGSWGNAKGGPAPQIPRTLCCPAGP